MNGFADPIAIAQTVARNIVPLVGILVFHWSTGNVLILYLLDTLLAIGMIVAALLRVSRRRRTAKALAAGSTLLPAS